MSRKVILVFLLSTSEVTSGVLCPVPGTPIQKSHGYTGTTPSQACNDDQATEAPFLSGETNRIENSLFSLDKSRLRGILPISDSME